MLISKLNMLIKLKLVKNATESITQLMETLSLLETPTEDVEEDGGQSNEN